MTVRSLPDSSRIAALRWYLRRLAGEIGVRGTVGAGILAFSVMYAVNAFPPLVEELDELQRNVSQSAPEQQSSGTNSDAQLMALPKIFPARTDLLTWLDRLHGAAESNQLQINLGEYKPGEHNSVLQTYELNFPVKADYVQLRGFLSEALTDNPSLSLDHISFRRQKSSDTELNAEIRMTQFLKAD